jgi:hypothetical protein
MSKLSAFIKYQNKRRLNETKQEAPNGMSKEASINVKTMRRIYKISK